MGDRQRENASNSYRRELFCGWVTAYLFPDLEELRDCSLKNSPAVPVSSRVFALDHSSLVKSLRMSPNNYEA